MGVPSISWASLVAHFALQSGKHSFRVFCSMPLGLVHSYIAWLRQLSNSGSFLVPFTDGSTSPLAKAAVVGIFVAKNAAADQDNVMLLGALFFCSKGK